MEKRTPHCKLAVVKAMISAGQVRATKTALEEAAALGIDFDDMLAVVLSLKSADFYKSMTTNANHRVWQDVYRPTTSFFIMHHRVRTSCQKEISFVESAALATKF